MMLSNNNKIFKIFITIIILILFNSEKLQADQFMKIGNDSVRIINPMMFYHLDLLKLKHKFEDITFKEYNSNSLQSIYDSLSNLYVPFKKYYAITSLWDYKIGLNVAFNFLIDSNTIYTLWVFIPDSIYDGRYFFKSNLMKKLFGLNRYGILAFKDSTHIKDLNQIYADDPKAYTNDDFYKEYLQLLKKKYGKSIKRK